MYFLTAPRSYQQQQHGFPAASQPFVNSHGGPSPFGGNTNSGIGNPVAQYYNHPNTSVYGGYPQQTRNSVAGIDQVTLNLRPIHQFLKNTYLGGFNNASNYSRSGPGPIPSQYHSSSNQSYGTIPYSGRGAPPPPPSGSHQPGPPGHSSGITSL